MIRKQTNTMNNLKMCQIVVIAGCLLGIFSTCESSTFLTGVLQHPGKQRDLICSSLLTSLHSAFISIPIYLAVGLMTFWRVIFGNSVAPIGAFQVPDLDQLTRKHTVAFVSTLARSIITTATPPAEIPQRLARTSPCVISISIVVTCVQISFP